MNYPNKPAAYRLRLLTFLLLICMVLSCVAAQPASAAESQTFYGWNLKDRSDWSGSWTTGNLGKNYREFDWVSYALVLDGYGGTQLPAIDVRYDYMKPSNGAIFVDLLRNFSYKYYDEKDLKGAPNIAASKPSDFIDFTPSFINRPYPEGTADNPYAPPQYAFWRLTPNQELGEVPANKTVVIYFEARLAPTFIWIEGQEYLLADSPSDKLGGDRYDGWTASHLGSGYTSGSSPHFTLQAAGIGAKTVPIPIPQTPGGEISGTKFHDINGDGIRQQDEPGLGGWEIQLETIIDSIRFTRTATTLADGSYSFTGLTAAAYTVKEIIQNGWTQTYPAAPGTHTVPLADQQKVSGKDFGNMLAAPAIDIEKATNGQDADSPTGPYIAVGDPVTWTYVVTNTGNVALTDIVIIDDKIDLIGSISSLAPGASQTLTANGTAEAGQYTNMGTVVGNYGSIQVSDSDPSHYFGEQKLICETAWAAHDVGVFRYNPGKGSGNWATYVEYHNLQDGKANIYAGQTTYAGYVIFEEENNSVNITVCLEDWAFAQGITNVYIQDYSKEPKGNPSPGSFAYKFTGSGTSLTVTVPINEYYGIHFTIEQ